MNVKPEIGKTTYAINGKSYSRLPRKMKKLIKKLACFENENPPYSYGFWYKYLGGRLSVKFFDNALIDIFCGWSTELKKNHIDALYNEGQGVDYQGLGNDYKDYLEYFFENQETGQRIK